MAAAEPLKEGGEARKKEKKEKATRAGKITHVFDKLENGIGVGNGYIRTQKEVSTNLALLTDGEYRLYSILLGIKDEEHISKNGLVTYYKNHGRKGISKSTIYKYLDNLESVGLLEMIPLGYLPTKKGTEDQFDFVVHEIPIGLASLRVEKLKESIEQSQNIDIDFLGMG